MLASCGLTNSWPEANFRFDTNGVLRLKQTFDHAGARYDSIKWAQLLKNIASNTVKQVQHVFIPFEWDNERCEISNRVQRGMRFSMNQSVPAITFSFSHQGHHLSRIVWQAAFTSSTWSWFCLCSSPCAAILTSFTGNSRKVLARDLAGDLLKK